MNTRTTALVTDSNAQLPRRLVDRFGIRVVPLTVVVDGIEYAEGVDLDADGFYAKFDGGSRTAGHIGGHQPSVATSQPSPGCFADAYRAAAEAGADEILSVHIGAAVSGTLNSARAAAATAPVPVRLVDTGTTSFGIGCCVWEAAEALGRGAGTEEAADAARSVAARVGNVFVVRALELAAAGGRVVLADRGAAAATGDPGTGDAIPVLSLVGSRLDVVGRATDLDEAAALMADFATAAGQDLRVAVGIADRSSEPLRLALEARLEGHPSVKERVRYRVGPSVGAHTGPGTVGAFFYPSP